MPVSAAHRLLLAAIVAASVAGAARAQGTLDRPIEVRARTVTGSTFAGKLTSWTESGFDGSFGERQWLDLVAPDLKRVFGQVMDRKRAAHWVLLGELLASAKDGRKLSDEAFGQARKLGAPAADVDAARTRGAAAAIRCAGCPRR